MKKYICELCGYIYDPEVGDPDGGIAPGTPFESIPDDWACPLCGAEKSDVVPYNGETRPFLLTREGVFISNKSSLSLESWFVCCLS